MKTIFADHSTDADAQSPATDASDRWEPPPVCRLRPKPRRAAAPGGVHARRAAPATNATMQGAGQLATRTWARHASPWHPHVPLGSAAYRRAAAHGRAFTGPLLTGGRAFAIRGAAAAHGQVGGRRHPRAARSRAISGCLRAARARGARAAHRRRAATNRGLCERRNTKTTPLGTPARNGRAAGREGPRPPQGRGVRARAAALTRWKERGAGRQRPRAKQTKLARDGRAGRQRRAASARRGPAPGARRRRSEPGRAAVTPPRRPRPPPLTSSLTPAAPPAARRRPPPPPPRPCRTRSTPPPAPTHRRRHPPNRYPPNRR